MINDARKKEILRNRLNRFIDFETLHQERVNHVGEKMANRLGVLEESYINAIADLYFKYRIGGRHGLNVLRTTYFFSVGCIAVMFGVYTSMMGPNSFFLFKSYIPLNYHYQLTNYFLGVHQMAEYDMIAYDWGLSNIFSKKSVMFWSRLIGIFDIFSWVSLKVIAIATIDLIHHTIHLLNHTIFYPFVGSYNVSSYVVSYIFLHWISIINIVLLPYKPDLDKFFPEICEVDININLTSFDFLMEAMKNQCKCEFYEDDDQFEEWIENELDLVDQKM